MIKQQEHKTTPHTGSHAPAWESISCSYWHSVCIPTQERGNEVNKMRAENNVPAIRFEGFSEEWKQNSTGYLCNYIVPGRNKPQTFGGDIPWVTTPDIIANSVSESKHGLAITREEAKRVGAKIVPKNSIIISCVGDLGIVAHVDNELIINQQLHAFIPKDIINKWFFLYGLETSKRYMENIATKTAVPYMNKDNCNSIPVVYPILLEQTKIGNYFQQLDTLIAQHQKKHDKLLNLKKALLEKLFPKQGTTEPEIRFKGFSGEWEEKQLDKVVEVRSGRDYKHLTHGDIPVFGTGGYMLSVNKALSYDENAIGIGRKGTIDKPYVLKAPFWTVDTLFYAVPRTKNNLDFVYAIFQKINWRQKDESTGVPSLSKVAINSINVFATLEKEQAKIGYLFKQLDTLITQHQAQLKKLDNIKQACLEKMFV